MKQFIQWMFAKKTENQIVIKEYIHEVQLNQMFMWTRDKFLMHINNEINIVINIIIIKQ